MLSVMIVASSLHWKNGLLATANGIELPLLYSAAAVALAFTGYGTYSLDGLFGLARVWTPATWSGPSSPSASLAVSAIL